MLNGQLFQQKMWEPVTNESVSGLLPTPSATEYKAGYKEVFYENGSFFRINSKGVKWGVRLADAVKILPTPTASDIEGGTARDVKFKNGTFYRENKKGERWGVKLRDAVTLLPTPTTMDHLPQRGFESMVKQTQVHRKGRTKLANLREAVDPQTVELFNKLQNANGNIEEIQSTQTGNDMYLNPNFVEEMMGYPIGWTV